MCESNHESRITAADKLIEKLETIKRLWEGLPSQEELDSIAASLRSLTESIEQVKDATNCDTLLDVDEVSKLAEAMSSVAESAKDWQELPSLDDLKEYFQYFPSLSDWQELPSINEVRELVAALSAAKELHDGLASAGENP